MRASAANFDEHGFAELVRAVEDIYLKVNAGTNDLNAGALNAQDQATVDDISSALTQHQDSANPHPQYLLAANYVAPVTETAVAFSASASDNPTTSYSIISTVSGTLAVDTGGLFSSGTFTTPETGYYQVSHHGNVNLLGSGATDLIHYVGVYINGGSTILGSITGVSYPSQPTIAPVVYSAIIPLTAGDTVDWRHRYVLNTGAVINIETQVRLSVLKVG